MADDLKIHQVELLSISSARITDGTDADGQRVVVATIRPDLPAYRPHNIAFSLEQGERLFHDLRAVLKRAGVHSLMALLVLGLSGCSAKVEVEEETSRPEATADAGSLTTERSKTAVEVELLSGRRSIVNEDGSPVELPPDGVLVVEG